MIQLVTMATSVKAAIFSVEVVKGRRFIRYIILYFICSFVF